MAKSLEVLPSAPARKGKGEEGWVGIRRQTHLLHNSAESLSVQSWPKAGIGSLGKREVDQLSLGSRTNILLTAKFYSLYPQI